MGNSCARTSDDDDANNMSDKCKCSCTATNPFLCTAPPLAVNVTATKTSMQPHHIATVLIHQMSSFSAGSIRDGSETSLSTPTAPTNHDDDDDDDDAFSTLKISAPSVALSVSSVGVNPLNVSFNPQVRILLDSDDDVDAVATTRINKSPAPPCKPTDDRVVTTRKETSVRDESSETLLSLVPFDSLSISGGCSVSPPLCFTSMCTDGIGPGSSQHSQQPQSLHRNQLAHKRSLEKRRRLGNLQPSS